MQGTSTCLIKLKNIYSKNLHKYFKEYDLKVSSPCKKNVNNEILSIPQN